MNNTQLTPLEDDAGCPFTFFEDKHTFKIYNDGENYIATLCVDTLNKRKPKELKTRYKGKELTENDKSIIYRRILRDCRKRIDSNKQRKLMLGITISSSGSSRSDKDILFDSLYRQTVKNGWTFRRNKTDMIDYIRAGMLKLFPDFEDLDDWIIQKIKKSLNNLLHRKKRFRRKAYLNKWNYFVTFTYDDKKQTEESFRKRLRKCLSNFHTRRGWKYMGVFEHAPETGRLHFHCLMFVPDGEMVGTITEKKDYSTAQQRMQTYYENDFFQESFGRNDFEELSEMQLKSGNTVEYIIKYLGKTGERVCYSRGIPTEIYKQLDGDDIITGFKDFVEKFIIFNRVVDHERDIVNNNYFKQMKLFISDSGKSWLIA